jgi:hypothetical protein
MFEQFGDSRSADWNNVIVYQTVKDAFGVTILRPERTKSRRRRLE